MVFGAKNEKKCSRVHRPTGENLFGKIFVKFDSIIYYSCEHTLKASTKMAICLFPARSSCGDVPTRRVKIEIINHAIQ